MYIKTHRIKCINQHNGYVFRLLAHSLTKTLLLFFLQAHQSKKENKNKKFHIGRQTFLGILIWCHL